jgi:serine-type D-Ala-D-Ala carboxypeptidase
MRPNETISRMLVTHVDEKAFPSAVYVVASKGNIVLADALGNAVCEPDVCTATLDTIYDIASLTKPLATGLLCAKFLERGELALDQPVSHYLQEFNRSDKQSITLRHLLTHCSGLPAWRPLYALAKGGKELVMNIIVDLPLIYNPGTRVVYSDLGFITLGVILEKLTGLSLAELFQKEVAGPLGLKRTFFNPDKSLRNSIAACESYGNAYERDMCKNEDLKDYMGWRNELIWGEVHDGNAYFLGGAAGHAGLFSTAIETAQIAQQFIPTRTMLLKPETCDLFQLNMTLGLEEDRSPGWQLASSANSTAGPDLPKNSFGHTGFTGTSCWVDAGSEERVFILLTNRTHAHALPFVNINDIRRRFHSLAISALNEEQSS